MVAFRGTAGRPLRRLLPLFGADGRPCSKMEASEESPSAIALALRRTVPRGADPSGFAYLSRIQREALRREEM